MDLYGVGGVTSNKYQHLGGMGKCQKYLDDFSQIFVDIRALKSMNMCQILSIYLTPNNKKLWPKKLGKPGELERLVTETCLTQCNPTQTQYGTLLYKYVQCGTLTPRQTQYGTLLYKYVRCGTLTK